MSHVTSVFVDGSCRFHEVRSVLEQLLGHPMTQRESDEGELYISGVMEVKVALFNEHGLEDDLDIQFSHYPYQINFISYAGRPAVEARRELSRYMALVVGDTLSELLGCHCMIVDNLQHVVQTFPAPQKTLQ